MKKNVKNSYKICVAITGSLCTGKTFVLNTLRNLGYPVFNFDAEVAELIKNDEEVKKDIKMRFPSVWHKGEINKANLAEIVFANPKELTVLETILENKIYHKRDDFVDNFKKSSEKIAFFEAPLLFERNNHQKYDLVILTHASQDVCRKRALSRGISELRYQQITSLQISSEIKREKSDYIIDTEQELNDINKQIEKILEDING